MSDPQVALVNMPMMLPAHPSLGLSLLKASLAEREIDCDLHYLNLRFVELVGIEAAEAIESYPTATLPGDWVFSEALHGSDPERDRRYWSDVIQDGSREHRYHLNRKPTNKDAAALERCREHAEAFLELCLEEVDWSQYRIVGFTSMFQQQLASLALAQRLKKRYPELLIVFGGANCEDTMGRALLAGFEFLNAVCIGRGEVGFPEYCDEILNGAPAPETSSLIRRDAVGTYEIQGAPLESSPIPDYSDFFTQRESLNGLGGEPPRMFLETSTGCWWGQKQHCTFCGLNGATMDFRHKSPERALTEIGTLIERYGHHTRMISAVDNIIPVEYISQVLPQLAEADLDIDLFYETKANLTPAQVKTFAQAGCRTIQPGIESLSNEMLVQMKKGIGAIRNIQLLKACREYGVRPIWNYLIGFPNEPAEAYADQPDILRKLFHLEPPSLEWVRIDRFSPLQVESATNGVGDLTPFRAYETLYPDWTSEQRADVAYYFSSPFRDEERVATYAPPIASAIDDWNGRASTSALFHYASLGRMIICDLRGEETRTHVLSDIEERVCLGSDEIVGIGKLIETTGLGVDDVERALEGLQARGLVVREKKRILFLANSLENNYFPSPAAWGRLAATVDAHPPD